MTQADKTCFRCLCKKPLEAFYKHSQMGDGRLNKCIECTKSDVRQHRQANLEKIRAYDKLRGGLSHRVAARKEYQQTPAGKAAHARALKAYTARFPNRDKARTAVGNAIRDGRLARLPCEVCGEQRTEGHHPDYDAPLSVVWLCNKHHREAHALARELDKEAA